MSNIALNPYLPSYEYVADGEPHVFGDRLYVFGSHDQFNAPDFCLGDYVCYSAPLTDLSDWKYEGVIYAKTQDPRNPKGKMHMCAPDVVQGNDGRYYLYYQLHELMITSVAVCDTPAGKYEFLGYVKHEDGTPWGEKKGDSFAFDPGLLKDDDGSIYLYVGFSPLPGFFKKIFQLRGCVVDGGVCLKLADDMMTVIGGEKKTVPGHTEAAGTEFEGHAFFEASSPRKINGKYYLIYSSELSHELCYAVSDYPDRDFHYGGTIVSIGNVGYQGQKEADNYTGNTHGGLVEIDGQWYVFYHRQTNLQKCARQGCAEKITILPDGSIPQVETTSCGLNQGDLPAIGSYEARIACTLTSKIGTIPFVKTHEKNKKNMHPYLTQSGVDRESNGDQYIANMRDGAKAGFRYFDFSKEVPRKVSVSLSGNGRGVMDVLASGSVDPIAKIPVDLNGKGCFDADITNSLQTREALYFRYQGTGYVDFVKFELKR